VTINKIKNDFFGRKETLKTSLDQLRKLIKLDRKFSTITEWIYIFRRTL